MKAGSNVGLFFSAAAEPAGLQPNPKACIWRAAGNAVGNDEHRG